MSGGKIDKRKSMTFMFALTHYTQNALAPHPQPPASYSILAPRVRTFSSDVECNIRKKKCSHKNKKTWQTIPKCSVCGLNGCLSYIWNCG